MVPGKGVSRYSVDGGELVDKASDKVFFDTIKNGLPEPVEFQILDHGAEETAFVEAATAKLLELIEG